jgi:hypothetical protein
VLIYNGYQVVALLVFERMTTKVHAQKRWILIGVISLTLTIGILDYLTGYLFSFFVFYFLPVSLAAWFIGKSGAIVFAIFCSIVWAVVYILTRHFVSDFITTRGRLLKSRLEKNPPN